MANSKILNSKSLVYARTKVYVRQCIAPQHTVFLSLGLLILFFLKKNVLSLSVSKTTKELLLTWESKDDKPVIVADDLRMPQFEMQKIASDKCHETNHMGKFVCTKV